MEPEDQAQGSETNESQEISETEKEEVSSDNQEAQTEDQSKEEKEVESKKYKLPDGREVTADELHSEYADKLLPEFTRRSQELAELKKAREEQQSGASDEARQAVEENDTLKNVQPEVKEAIIKITEPVIEERLAQRQKQEDQKAEARAFEEKLDRLEKEYTGSNGLPKFDKNEVLTAIKRDGDIFDPEAKFRNMYFDEFVDASIKKAMKKTGGTKTEKTGQQGSRQKPKSEPPKDFREAAERLRARLK